ncbi:MAG TPA: hypothetical protein VG435_01380 [Acidimicrobiales bacterium]|jgi:hypothetical protein|nr:hypothetical protein [Acidimicrobiales bacterium]
MFRHHQDKDPADPSVAGAPSNGPSEMAKTTGLVMEVVRIDATTSRIRVDVDAKDGPHSEFTSEVDNLYQPDVDSPDAQRLTMMREAQQLRHANKIPKVQMPISVGSRIPILYDPRDHKKMAVDFSGMRKQAVSEYIEMEKQNQARHQAEVPVTGPPWAVPDHCPNCGAPVDQAVSSRAADPHCDFCHEPIPVTPLKR